MKKYKLKKTIWFVKIIPCALKQWDNLTWLDLLTYYYIFCKLPKPSSEFNIMILAFWKLFHARSPSNERIWRGPLELEHESNFMFKVNYYVHFNWHFLLTLTLTGERSLPVLNRFDVDRRQLESHMVFKI